MSRHAELHLWGLRYSECARERPTHTGYLAKQYRQEAWAGAYSERERRPRLLKLLTSCSYQAKYDRINSSLERSITPQSFTASHVPVV